MRSMFDGKMSAILSGAGGASYQMCTTIHRDLKDRDLVIQGFHRSITDAIEISVIWKMLMNFSHSLLMLASI